MSTKIEKILCTMSQRHIDTLQYSLRKLQASDLDITSIWLYGSCAAGKARFMSDVDLAVFLSGKKYSPSYLRKVKCDCIPDDWRLPEADIHIFRNCCEDADLRDVYFKSIFQGGIRIENCELL